MSKHTDLHYRKDELVLIDAGAQYGGYITDISRTWPNNGVFTPAQRDLYYAVLSAQRHAVSLCRENADTTLDKIHSTAERMLKDNLRDLGFDMSGNVCLRSRIFRMSNIQLTFDLGPDEPLPSPHRPLHWIGCA